MNPLRALADYSRKRKLGIAMYENLRRYGRPGGVDVSRLDVEGVAALMWLLENRRDITVVKNRTNVTLMFHEDVDRTFTPDVAAAMYRGSIIGNRGEDLFHVAGRDDDGTGGAGVGAPG